MVKTNIKDQVVAIDKPEQVQKVQMVHRKPVLLGYKVKVVYKNQGLVDCMFIEGTDKQKLDNANKFYERMLNVLHAHTKQK